MKKSVKAVCRFASGIEDLFAAYGTNVILSEVQLYDCFHRFIFRLVVQPGTKFAKAYDCASEIKGLLRLPLFEIFKTEEGTFLLASDRPLPKVMLSDILNARKFTASEKNFPVALGANMFGGFFVFDLAEAVHVLYAGATNSGKSMALKVLVLSLLKNEVSKVNLLLIGVRTDALDKFSVPHLSFPVVKTAEQACYALSSLMGELNRRADLNDAEKRSLPLIVCVIDEFPALLTEAKSTRQFAQISAAVSSILQRGRGSRISLVLAAQNPTADYVQADISNITTRVAFRCAKKSNSRTILDENGAEKLPGKGAMLYMSPENPAGLRLQGSYVSDEDIDMMVGQINCVSHDLSNKFVIPDREAPTTDQSEFMASLFPKKVETTTAAENRTLLARVIIYVLSQKVVSGTKIEKWSRDWAFGTGISNKRAREYIRKLSEMGVLEKITDRNVRQPLKVIPQCIGDLSTEVITMLTESGFTIEDIEAAFSARAENGAR